MKPNISLLTLTIPAAAAVEANRFVTQAGGYASAGGLPFGVTRTGAESVGDLMPVDVLGTTVVEAGAAILADKPLMVDASGRAVTHDGDGDKHAVARSMDAAAALGDLIEVFLVPSAGVLVTAA